ncbi:MAG: hypothetical protein WBD22_05945 [Pyrinomonadaceae bacterium]
MKNSLNLVLVLLFLTVLGCSCPQLEELAKNLNKNTASPTPAGVNNTDDNSSSPSASPTAKAAELTMVKYNQLKTNMPKSEVEQILGGPGTEISSSSGGGMNFSVYKWEGDNYKSIIISFRNDKIMSKSQVGLK